MRRRGQQSERASEHDSVSWERAWTTLTSRRQRLLYLRSATQASSGQFVSDSKAIWLLRSASVALASAAPPQLGWQVPETHSTPVSANNLPRSQKRNPPAGFASL